MLKQEHLSEIVERFGSGDGTAEVVDLIERGLHAAQAVQQAERIASGRTSKVNPYVTDSVSCPRKVHLSLQNVPETDPPGTDSLVNFGVGSATEEWLAEVIEAAGVKVIREVRIAIPVNDTEISGRIDFLFYGAGRLIELKTIASRSMGFMLKGKCGQCGRFWSHSKDGEPYATCNDYRKTQGCGALRANAWVQEKGQDSHRAQLNQYVDASHKGLVKYLDPETNQEVTLPPVKEAFLVYVVKDAVRGEPPIHAFRIDYNPGAAQAQQERLAAIKASVDRGEEAPPIPDGYTWGKYPCHWCPFEAHCHNGARNV